MINITARNFELTKALNEYVNKRLSKITKYTEDDQDIDVVMNVNTYGQKIEVSLVHNGNFVKAESIDEDLYTATDLVTDKITKQLRRITDKESSIKKKSVRYLDNLSKDMYDKYSSVPELDDELVGQDSKTPKITKRNLITFKPMFEDEAVKQMELLEHRSFMFYNATTNSVCMLYKINEDEYGIVEAE